MWGFLLQTGCAESARRDHPNAGLGEEGTPHRNLSIQVRIRRIPNREIDFKTLPFKRHAARSRLRTASRPADQPAPGHTSHKDKPNISLDLSYVTNDMDPARNSDYIFVRRAPRLGQTLRTGERRTIQNMGSTVRAHCSRHSHRSCALPGRGTSFVPPRPSPATPRCFTTCVGDLGIRSSGVLNVIVFISCSCRHLYEREGRAHACFSLCVSHCVFLTVRTGPLGPRACACCVFLLQQLSLQINISLLVAVVSPTAQESKPKPRRLVRGLQPETPRNYRYIQYRY